MQPTDKDHVRWKSIDELTEQHVGGQIFGVTDEEVEQAILRARIAFYEEQDLVREYMEVAYNRDISVSQCEG